MVTLYDQAQVAERLEGLLHEDTQGFSLGMDLTVAEVQRLTSGSRLDFGGSEFEAAQTETLTPEKADPKDDYGWWHLSAGSYLVRYNEKLSLKEGELALVTPHTRLLQAGASHGAFSAVGETTLRVLLTVSEVGCSFKENARVSRLVVFAK